MKYYIIAGEVSGDLHASNLMRELKKSDPLAEFRAWGGDLMQEQGAEIVRHIRDISFMGFLEVAVNLKTILRNIRFCKRDIMEYKPDVVILVDYPGFNLRIAEFVKAQNIRVFYYISPQIWAWKQGRVKKIRRVVDRMYVILPFEKDFYKGFGMDVDFSGHPLLDAIEQYKQRSVSVENKPQASLDPRPVIALLPGSRQQELSNMLKRMLSVIPEFPECRFVVAASANVPIETYQTLTAGSTVEVVVGQTYDLLSQARAALVTSGTATLETALFGVPEVVCYKGSALSYAIAKRVVKIKYISLVNLILDRPAVKELIQDDLRTDYLIAELKRLLYDQEYRQHMLDDMQELRIKLGGPGASARTARMMVDRLKH